MLVFAAAWLAQGAEWAHAGSTRELWVRAAVRGGDALAIERALEDPDWVARAAALEALRRAARRGVGRFPDARVLALARARGAPEEALALAALAGRTLALELSEAELVGHADERPAVALARIALLEGLPRERGVPPLAALCAHADARVRDAAQAALAARGDAVSELASTLWRVDPQAERESWLDGLERLERQDGAVPLATALDGIEQALVARSDLEPRSRSEGLGAIAAVRALRGLPFDEQALAGGLAEEGPFVARQHALVLRAARSLAPDGGALAQALLHVAHARPQQTIALDAALAAAPRLEWLAGVGEHWSDEQALGLWERVGARAQGLPAGAGAVWLAARRGSELRLAVVEAASALEETDWLVLALDDPDPDVAALAFRALAHAVCDASTSEGAQAALHRAWRAQDARQRVESLRLLPRECDLAAFREDLLGLGEADPAARAACAELLGGAVAEPSVRAALERWLEQALQSAGADGQEARGVALAALRGMAAGGDEAALALVEAAAQRTAELDPTVAKRSLALLAASPAGLRRLDGWLAPRHPSRLRSEAALGLATSGDERAAAVLAQTYPSNDGVLRARALRALEPLSGDPARSLASAVLGSTDASAELVRLAAEWFARHGPAETLIEALGRARDPERDDACIVALGRRAAAGDRVARAWLTEELERVAPGDELEVARLESVLAAAALAGLRADELRGDWLARPFARAADDLKARLRGERLAAPTFLYRGELALARSLASRGELMAQLQRPGLEALDARLLAHLGLAALEGEPVAALVLLDLGRVGLSGEDPGEDGAAVELELRRARVEACEAAGRFDLAVGELESLLADRRALRLDARAELAWLGEFDPEQGRDGSARLESALWQARAWEARARGDRARALECAAQAALRLGRSADARSAQARLEVALR